jgi:PAS domain S-box-containing protein
MNDNFGRDTSHHLRLLVDHVPSMLAYWDRDLRCRFANRAYETWFGVDPDSLVGTSIRDLLGPQLFALNEPYIRAALNGEKQVFERVVPGPDGTKRHSLATYVPDLVDGKILGFIAHVTEITKLKETEAALRSEVAQREHANERLRSSEASLREAQRLGQVGSWEWEIAPDIVIWSEELYRIFGRDPKRLPPNFGEHPALYKAHSWVRLQSAVAATVRTGEPFSLELEYVRPDGESGWLEARGEGVRVDLGDITKLRGTVHEVTIRHRAEDSRIEAKAIESASRNKTELMSRVSHELRTPLNAILGFAQLCRADAALDPKHRRWAEVILGSGQHMLDLVDEILDLSAAEMGQVVVKPVDVDLVSILRECLVEASELARAAGLTLQMTAADAWPVEVRCDPNRVKQVINNLLSNAVKYTRTGGVINVSVVDLGGTVEIAVQDSGIALSAEQLDRIFSPFERLGAEKTATPGTGIGLALSKTLTELMGGTIRVESLVGAGSTFIVSLPKKHAR